MQKYPDALPSVVAAIESGRQRGLQSGVQLFVSLRGEVLADCGIGESRPGVPMTRETLMPLLSAGKPLTAVAALQLVEQGRLTLDTRIGDVIPEFSTAGKHDVTLRHLLTHTGGFPSIESGWPEASWTETLRRICESTIEPGWRVGQDGAYHVASSWFVLGEMIQRIDGRSFSDYLRSEVCEPLRMTHTWNGMPWSVWSLYDDQLGVMSDRVRGETSELPWHESMFCEAPAPGGNTRGPVHELASFYQCLLNGGELNTRRVLNPETVAEMLQRHRVGIFDQTLQHVIDFGLGLIINSNRYGIDSVPYGYGSEASEQAFGHGGSQSSIGFADPVRDLIVCYAANCRPGEGQHQKRHREIMRALEADLRTLTD